MIKMDLGDVRDVLYKLKAKGVNELNTGWDYNSWRGVYREISMEPTYMKESVQSLIEKTEEAIGSTFEGYKGGSFYMSKNTPVHVDSYGCYSDGREAIIWSKALLGEEEEGESEQDTIAMTFYALVERLE